MQAATTTKGTETKTIMEFLAESPNVDVSRAWERCWNIHSKIADRVQARFDVQRHLRLLRIDSFPSGAAISVDGRNPARFGRLEIRHLQSRFGEQRCPVGRGR